MERPFCDHISFFHHSFNPHSVRSWMGSYMFDIDRSCRPLCLCGYFKSQKESKTSYKPTLTLQTNKNKS